MSFVVCSSLFLGWAFTSAHHDIFIRSDGKCKMQYYAHSGTVGYLVNYHFQTADDIFQKRVQKN